MILFSASLRSMTAAVGGEPGVLVELGVVEQRYRAVLEVLDEGVPVTVVALRYGVARQTVHEWLRRYANEGGLGGLAEPVTEAGYVPASDAGGGGGAGGGDPPGASGVGAVAGPLAAGA